MTKMKRFLLATAALVALGVGGQAQATCVSSALITAPDPSAGTTCSSIAPASTVDIVFAFKAAADTNVLFNGATQLFNNQVDQPGTKVVLTGLTIGQTLNFVFENMNTGDSFQAGVAASDGEQHITVPATY